MRAVGRRQETQKDIPLALPRILQQIFSQKRHPKIRWCSAAMYLHWLNQIRALDVPYTFCGQQAICFDPRVRHSFLPLCCDWTFAVSNIRVRRTILGNQKKQSESKVGKAKLLHNYKWFHMVSTSWCFGTLPPQKKSAQPPWATLIPPHHHRHRCLSASQGAHVIGDLR